MTEKNDTLDSICGAALLMGFPRATTGMVEFTGTIMREHKKSLLPLASTSSTSLSGAPVTESKPATFVPSREAIDSRLELLKANEYVLPVEGRYWRSLSDYLAGRDSYKGEIGREKAEELGLYDPKTLLGRVYADSVTFPRQEEKEE